LRNSGGGAYAGGVPMKQCFSFQWRIIDEYDQRCKHCYNFSQGHPEIQSMNWSQMEGVIDNCIDFCDRFDRLPHFYLTGGDPIMRPDIWRLLKTLKAKHIHFTIMGKPFRITAEVCKRLKCCGCQKYQMSLDGMRETLDWFRKHGSSDATLEKIATIKEAGIRIVIMTTVSSKNISEIPDIIDAVVKFGADVFAFARFCPTSLDKSNNITPQEYHELLGIKTENSINAK
jgi:MoaA/NifB/PqqE/SkfB family radical SAM enzyme